jgi:hypothetical protein
VVVAEILYQMSSLTIFNRGIRHGALSSLNQIQRENGAALELAEEAVEVGDDPEGNSGDESRGGYGQDPGPDDAPGDAPLNRG